MQPKTKKRLRVILLIGALLVIGSIFYLRYFFARPMGTGPAGPAVDAAQFTNPWTTRKVRLVGIGDSVTAGLGAASPDLSYFNRLIRNPSHEFAAMRGLCLSAVLPQLEYENLAVSGSASDQHLEVVENSLASQPADVFGLIVLTTGGNDLIHSYGRRPPKECAMYGATLPQATPWIERFEQRLNTMLDIIPSRFPGGCEIFLANIYDPTDGIGDAPSVYLPHWADGLAIHALYNQAITRCAASRPHVHLVPLYETFLGHGSHCRQFWRSTYDSQDPYYWYFDNIEDPNDRGYDAIRRVFLNTILQHSTLVRSAATPHATAQSEARETE